MDTAKYSILDILEFKNLDQFIVPEIQRDYVWKVTDVLHLLSSIKDGFEGSKKDIPYLGFIYAYNDKDYVYKYFLVDGQQRMTTIFLLLLACHQKIGKKLPEYLFKQEKLKLDYKVRQATHDFLTDLVRHCKENPSDFNLLIKDQVWFHKEYETDRTIYNIVENYNAIRKWTDCFDQKQTEEFLKFVENKVELSYFDIENGRQGEELYIYMNSRGRHLEQNETLKANYLSNLEIISEKERRGLEWEKWQDFFWKHRGDNPDADAGFNEFLQIVQIINMSVLGKSSDEISNFASGKSNQVIDFKLLPKKFEELEKYFKSFEWLVTSKRVIKFFKEYEKSENFFTSSSSIDLWRKQIYYLRILPIITFISCTGLKDEEVIIRFIRFFYNISRKDSSIGKDISNQLPNAIKLMIEYGNSKERDFDVCDLMHLKKGRRVLINEEEVIKLSLFKTPPHNKTREEMEILFWSAEDHLVLGGEISFLLNKYYDKDQKKFDLKNYEKTWTIFKSIFTNSIKNNALISRALLYYGNTWVRKTPNYYYNYDCQDWYTIVRLPTGENLIDLLEDLHGKNSDFLEDIFKVKAKDYFIRNKLNSITSIKSKKELFEQIKILVAIDYYTEQLIWKEFGYIAEDDRFTFKDDIPFFNSHRVIYNISRYIKDGWQRRILHLMKDTLQNDVKLNEVLKKIKEA